MDKSLISVWYLLVLILEYITKTFLRGFLAMKAIKEILQTLCNELSRLTSWFIRISQLIINTFVCWLLWLSLTSIYLILVQQELDLNGDNEYLKGYDGNRSHLKWSTTICNTALGSTNQKQKINATRMNTFIHRPKKSWKFVFIAAVQITLQFDNFFSKFWDLRSYPFDPFEIRTCSL